MTHSHHRDRFHLRHETHERPGFPVYLVRDSGHVPNIETMMERHRVLRLADAPAWLEHITVQHVPNGYLLYVKLSDATQMSHHPEYEAWLRQALPLDEALGPGWRTITENDAREMLGDVTR